MSLLSGLYVGTTALKVANDALNTTSHNISNADTAGYTRQQVSQSTRNFVMISNASTQVAAKQTGLGVQYAETRQVRSYFLDQNYRREAGRSAFYEVSYEALIHMQDLLGESSPLNFGEAIEEFWKSIQEFANDPSSAVTQGLFVSKAQTLLERAKKVYKSMQDYQNNLNNDVKKYVDKLNDYGKQLVELNKQIANIECSGVENANDYRDARNYILDQMSELCNITYGEDIDGYVSVQIEGVEFVKRNVFYEMKLYENDNGYYMPFWPHIIERSVDSNGRTFYTPEEVEQGKVFDLEREISSATNTDIGRLKGILLARGDHSADYSEIEPGRVNVDKYNREISQSICMNVEAEFDLLIKNIVTAVNGVLKKVAQDASESYLEKNIPNLEDMTPEQQEAEKKKLLPKEAWDKLFTRIDVWPSDGETGGWSINNIMVNEMFRQQPALLNMINRDEEVNHETVDRLKTAFDEELYRLNPNTEKRSSAKGYYEDFVGQIANTGSVTKLLYEYQLDMQEETSFAREQIHGVSTDEELQFMIKFQNAYNAASRYITTLNSMLENLIAQFGA